MSEEPKSSGENRNPDGTFKEGVSGNPNGRPPGSLSLVKILKDELEKVPQGQQVSYAVAFIKKILHQALIDGDTNSQKMIMNYVDGMPLQKTDLTSLGEKINPIPIYGGISQHNSDSENIQPTEENPSS